MTDKKIQFVKYKKTHAVIELQGKIGSIAAKAFCKAINNFKLRDDRTITIDFSQIDRPYINGMLPIIAIIWQLRELGYSVIIVLPTNKTVKQLFELYDWKNLLLRGVSVHEDNLKNAFTCVFHTANEQFESVNKFMNFILGRVEISIDVLRGLEWSINELTDNVLTHSQSKNGGIFQAIINKKKKQIEFGIVDNGIGIYNSIYPILPQDSSDLDAINASLKSGVTRDKEVGQGNGLAGSLKIANLCNGTFEVRSGRGWINLTSNEKAQELLFNENESFPGTLVTAMMNISTSFSIVEGLSFGNNVSYVPNCIIDLKYEMESEDSFYIKMKNESIGYGSRDAGKFIRQKVLNILNSETDYQIYIDWDGVPFISSSFADEFIGKLFISLGEVCFNRFVKNLNMDELVQKLINKSITQRLLVGNLTITE